ncbi:hypothetical protein [Streptomyces sp. MK7]|uniref:hypothetical protein n=1 Tax=Streptomyces sp. MK7 TaxID=3067635 RepID=UPI00292D289C|nr:hypothetical protein [Streptomyces sp. MK7]
MAGCVVGPGGRDQGLAAVGEDEQELQPPAAVHLPENLKAVALQRVVIAGDADAGHRASPFRKTCAAPGQLPACSIAHAASVTVGASKLVSASARSMGTPSARLAQPQHLALATGAGQPPASQLGRHPRPVDERQRRPVPERGDDLDERGDEVVTVQPPIVADQQLDGHHRAVQPGGPGPQRGREVLDTGSKSGLRSTRSRTRP